MEKRKYEKLVYTFQPEYNEVVPDNADANFVHSPQAYFRGACQIPGSKFNMGFQIFEKPFFLDRVPHKHDCDEYLIFLGATMGKFFEFDADIEFTIGKGDEAETYKVTKPTIIRIPAGVWHCPLNFIRVDKPILFQAGLMQEMFGGIYDTPQGDKEMWYNGPKFCKFNPGKKCDSCRACIQEDWHND